MTSLLKKTVAALGIAVAATTLCALTAHAADAGTKPVKSKAKSKSKAVAGAGAQAAGDEAEPDVADAQPTEFNCELGNKITIYSKLADDSQIALRWNKRLHRMTRVSTTTGAQRFENVNLGLTWIGIPAKGMLLDSKKQRQLANECRNAEQAKAAVAETPEAIKG